MISRDTTVANGVLAWSAVGHVTREDVKAFQDELGQAAPDRGGAAVLIDLAAMTGADLDAIWQDARHTLEYARRIGRLAVVGDARWERLLTQLSNMVPGIDARFFEPAQALEARSWLGAG
jgi:hypothetical protein